ncbi:hypothetical protein PFLUV_G00044860 [Perca fluviatilis]|uniref:Uncharacterized protein n=1 Tax=Perca fluviatilis TaxID=8168 RepID=A0A6A5FLD1_PERFL|nr:hypothetical protein PFLUV_G00044860 [Perca fluviatilis]
MLGSSGQVVRASLVDIQALNHLMHSQTPQSSQPTTTTVGAGPAQQQPKSGQAPPQGRQPGVGSAAVQPALTATKMDATPAAAAAATTGIKPTTGATTTPQPIKIATPPLTGIGSKAPPVGIGSKPEGQQSRRENWEMLCLALGRSSLHFGELKEEGYAELK